MVGTDGSPGLERAVDWRCRAVLRGEVYDGVAAIARHVPQDQRQDCGRVDCHVY